MPDVVLLAHLDRISRVLNHIWSHISRALSHISCLYALLAARDMRAARDVRAAQSRPHMLPTLDCVCSSCCACRIYALRASFCVLRACRVRCLDRICSICRVYSLCCTLCTDCALDSVLALPRVLYADLALRTTRALRAMPALYAVRAVRAVCPCTRFAAYAACRLRSCLRVC
jgi:hypothetical protein